MPLTKHTSNKHESRGEFHSPRTMTSCTLHSAGVNHAGIAYAPQGASIGEIIRGLMMIHQVLEAEGMIGHIEYLCGPKKPGISVRPLQGSLSVAGDPGREPPIGSLANMCGLGEVCPLKSRQ